jgi:hypothetical protein
MPGHGRCVRDTAIAVASAFSWSAGRSRLRLQTKRDSYDTERLCGLRKALRSEAVGSLRPLL